MMVIRGRDDRSAGGVGGKGGVTYTLHNNTFGCTRRNFVEPLGVQNTTVLQTSLFYTAVLGICLFLHSSTRNVSLFTQQYCGWIVDTSLFTQQYCRHVSFLHSSTRDILQIHFFWNTVFLILPVLQSTVECGPDPFYTALIRIQKQLYGSSCISVSLPLILASRLSLSFYAPPMLDGTPSRR